MSYTPTEWESTDVVTATRMNALETAVGEMNMSYTPNTWSDGDILSAEKMNTLEQAVASGGGGSSDFSTAEVAVNANVQFEFFVPLINDEFGYLGSYYNFNSSDSGTLVVGLYKGKALTQFFTTGGVSVSGNAQLADDEILITGDCTITIS